VAHRASPPVSREETTINTTGIKAGDAITKVLADTKGLPAYLAGSSVAAQVHGKHHAYTDIDLFVPNQGSYYTLVAHLLNRGYSFESDRFERMWARHLEYGFKAWHTNSMKLLDDTTGTEVNVIYKRVDGHETTRLSQVLESFDFGLLGVGYETLTGRFKDMREYLFPGVWDPHAPDAPLPMMDYRADTVGKGYMSQHIMMRTPGRFARYASTYGYDLSLVKPTLVAGYQSFADYKLARSKPEDLALGQIAETLGQHIALDMYDELLLFEKKLVVADGLDDIMEALE
jgi:hypothetical protein